MSTAAEVRAAWASVFSDATIEAITTNAFNYPFTQESEKEVARLYYAQQINFFEYIVSRSPGFGLTSALTYEYTVELRYVRQQDVAGTAHPAVVDAFDSLWTVIRSVLGNKWSNTVDRWQTPGIPPRVTQQTIGGQLCWVGTLTLTGFKTVSS